MRTSVKLLYLSSILWGTVVTQISYTRTHWILWCVGGVVIFNIINFIYERAHPDE